MLVVTFVLVKRCAHANRHIITFSDAGRGCMQHVFDAGEEHGEQCPDNVRLHGEGLYLSETRPSDSSLVQQRTSCALPMLPALRSRSGEA